mmetsp:Transcript_9661/g.27206  ORF Transcript_9661/g.27206 Transcript_9661/m.27206 type:complete len:918 (-) Transcript_9661:76-2829(-)
MPCALVHSLLSAGLLLAHSNCSAERVPGSLDTDHRAPIVSHWRAFSLSQEGPALSHGSRAGKERPAVASSSGAGGRGRIGAVLSGGAQGVIVFSLAFLWWLSVSAVSSGTPWPGGEKLQEFHSFSTKLHHNADTKGSMRPFSLCFHDPDLERGFTAENAKSVCKHLRPLCVGLLVLGAFGSISFHPQQGVFAVNPSLVNWQSSAAMAYNCSWAVYLALCGLMYFHTTKQHFQTSRFLEVFVMSWFVLVVLLVSLFFNRWYVSRLNYEHADDVFLSYTCDEDHVFYLFALVLYPCMHTKLRFIVLLPFSMAMPLVYVSLCGTLGSPEGILRSELHVHRGWEAEHPSLHIIMANVLRLLALVATTLYGKHIMERHQRIGYLKAYQSFKMMEECGVQAEEGAEEQSSTAIGKARSHLQKAAQALELLAASPATAQVGLTEALAGIKDHIAVAQVTLRRSDTMFKVVATEALSGKSYVGNDDVVKFLNVNLGGEEEDKTTRRDLNRPSKRRLMSAFTRVLHSVQVAQASELAGDFGARWEFDALALARKTQHASCLFAGEMALVQSAYGEVLGATNLQIRAWVRAIHARYLPNAYHNESHATNVSHMCMWFARQTGWMTKAAPVDVCALLIAALAHDVGHFSRTNQFCQRVENSISIIWNDKAALENMHSAACFAVMRGTADLLEGLTDSARAHLRHSVVSFILATDIKSHHAGLATLQAAMEDESFLVAPEEDAGEPSSAKYQRDIALAGEAIIRTADIGHGLLPWHAHLEWSYRVNLEFFEQGDEELALGLPLSPLCGRAACNISSSQTFFIDYMCSQLFVCLGKMAEPGSPGKEGIEACLDQGKQNKEHWKLEGHKFDPMTLSMEVIINKFTGEQHGKVVYPYEFEEKDVAKEKVGTHMLLGEIFRYQRRREQGVDAG